MIECSKYADMLSSFHDGALSQTAQADLQQHLDSCEACRALLDFYGEISNGLAPVPPPADFSAGVMAKIRALPENSTKKTPTPRLRHWRPVALSLAGVAACFLLIFSGVLHQSSSSTPSRTQSSAAPMVKAATSEAVSAAAAAPSQNAEDNGSMSVAAGAEATAETQAPTAAGGYFAVITIHGPLPELLKSRTPVSAGDGTFRYEIDTATFQKLLAAGYTAELDTGSQDKALVIYSAG